MARLQDAAETGQMGVRVWILLPVVLGAVLGSCSIEESANPDAGSSTRSAAATTEPNAGDPTRSPSATTDSFAPEPLSGQLIAGISPELRALLTAGPIGQYYPVQNRWTLNGNGDVLVLTAKYGDPYELEVACPAPWTGAIRWAGSDGSTRSWTAQVAADSALPTVRGFILFGGCAPEGVPVPTLPWYVDGSGRIGPLRTIPGPPPFGVEAINPSPPSGCEQESYLVEADSDRVWRLDPISPLPRGVCAYVVAQDEAGVQWVQANASYSHEAALWWREPGERSWRRRNFGGPSYSGQLLYSGSTIGILGQSGERMEQFTLHVSTDRGRTWTTRPLGVASDFGALWHGGSWDLYFRAQPDGTLVAFVNTQLAQEQPGLEPHLMRSTDAGWTTFERVPGVPVGYSSYGGVPTFGFCNGFSSTNTTEAPTDFACHISHDAGDTWRTLMVPPL